MISEHSNNQLEIELLSTEQKLSLMFARCELDELKTVEHLSPAKWALRGILAGLILTALIMSLAREITAIAVVSGFVSSVIITSVCYFWEVAERHRIGVLSAQLERFD